MKFKNLKDRPDKVGLWWMGIEEPQSPEHISQDQIDIWDKSTKAIGYLKKTVWLSDEERTRQIFEAGFKAGDPAFFGEDSVFLIAFEQFIKE